MTEFTTLDYRVEDGVAIATFSRPEQMNTFGLPMVRDLLALFDLTDADDKVRALIITGSGRAFCAGADLSKSSETFTYKPGEKPEVFEVNGVRRDASGRVALRIFRSLKPVIAAVNGAAVGVGATILLPMDARLASKSARFGFVFSRRGLTPEACSSWFLPRLVGVPTTLDWLYSGRVFGAEEALQRGLVQSLHEPENLLEDAIRHAHTLTRDSAPVSVALSRQMIWRSFGAAHPMNVHGVESRALQERGRSDDVKEGVGAFLEKRSPSFPNVVSSDLQDFFPPEPDFE